MFRTEADLVAAYQQYLNALGVETQTEVPCARGGYAADLVSDNCVFEAKLYLERGDLYQALGQVSTYNGYLNRPKMAIIGMLPVDPEKKRASIKLAAVLMESHPNVQVLFVDQDTQFRKLFTKIKKGQKKNAA